ncbi:DUF397 domain-containing protein [Streptomyces sp. NPDC093544]|uniref:DUF397 domain-containing protein n=1 Tax=Streptomyces sp. NPDC093544 TaxID=3155200 RepID=UPI003431ADE1
MSTELSWFKSSYSDSEGSACLEVAYTWHKSSNSDGPHAIHVRDSKLGARSPQVEVPSGAWDAFVTYAAGT